MVEYRDASLLHCTEDTDSDSSYYDAEEGKKETDLEEGRQQIETGSAYVRNTDLVNIDCLAQENVRSEQDQQPEIHMIKQWKSENKMPTWSHVAQYCPELKAYWSAWDSLVVIDEILYKRKLSDKSVENKPRIVLPTVLRKKCFTVLHDTVTAAHLGSQKTLEKIKQRFYWYECRKDVEYWCRTCDICASRKPLHRRTKAPMK